MKKVNEYKTNDLKMFPIDSEVSQYELNQKINEMDKDVWESIKMHMMNCTFY